MEYGILDSHASETTADALVAGGHPTFAEAENRGTQVSQAQPGIERETMHLDREGTWRSAAELKAREVISQRWA
jgi:hypothetical protein